MKRDKNGHTVPYNIDKRPPTEVQLFALQTKYLKTRDKNIWREMFQICYNYARSMILKRRRGQKFVEEEIINDQAISVALVFMRQYLIHPEFYVKGSFFGMIQRKVFEILYKKSQEEQHLSLNETYGDNDAGMEVGDFQERVGFRNFMNNNENYNVPDAFVDKINDIELIDTLLEEVDESLGTDSYLMLVVRLYLILFLRIPRNRHSKKLFIAQWCKTLQQERVIDAVVLELRNRFKDLSCT